jgi:cytochrome P450
LKQPNLLEPPAGLREWQLRGSVHPVITAVGDPGWLVTGRAEVLAWLDDDRLGRSYQDPARAARTGESVLFGGPSGAFDTEKADHKRMRALLQPHFTPARMRALRPRVQQLTGELLDSMATGDRPSDLIQAVAVPLPVLVIASCWESPSATVTGFGPGPATLPMSPIASDRWPAWAPSSATVSSLWPLNETSRPTTSSRDWLLHLASAHSKPPNYRCFCSSPGMRPLWTKSARVPCSCSP